MSGAVYERDGRTPPLIRPPLDPEFAFLLELDLGFGGSTFDVDKIRSALIELIELPPALDGVVVRQFTIREDPELVLQTFAPSEGGPHPCLLWFHGGGYVIGTATMDADRLQRWAAQLGYVAISVEYRLAPEHPFPAAHDDAMAAMRWVRSSADVLDIEPDRIVVGGASAGGGIAAATVLAARDEDLTVAGQLLFYPMLDDRQQTPSSQWDAPVWSPAANQYGWRSYLDGLYEGKVPPYAAPARRSQFGGLPPSLLIVGGADGFFDENMDYAAKLTRAGIPTELRVYAGAPHGFDLMAPEASASRAALRDAEQWLSSRSEMTEN